ncbi:hypothetical protein HZF24_09035 [Sedimentibacter hydroxybenzoicus DSM 7310]|uniref:Type 4 fimbrial biogenesis protein PilX N-terminal domain-containing protein n=1 Tax=Sedimentibacter hydroxybenzoicus DSM 7310 TaxID=1123245 RepID=A0A974GWC2_SEDHY|nr:hypothetical protein [Sedimentibacter hydroxybenzoicus]NYB74288.1 hypothetical protein [Sedimentibacter hydroxybenzoicus DSM 7310]
MLNKNKGSILILMVIIIAIISSISLTTLSIAVSQYQIKKTNSNIKRAFYLSEDGINSASLRACDLICRACADSANKTDEYVELYPDDIAVAESLFKNNYKLYVINRAASTINNGGNPSIKIINYNDLFFMDEKLTLHVKSTYVSDAGIEKSLNVNLVILIPCYADIKAGILDFSELFHLSSFDL